MSELAQKLWSSREVKKPEGADFLDRAFLDSLRVAESVGVGGTPLKLYNDVIQRGRTEPITEGDFPPEELNALRQIIERKIQSSGATEGQIDYPDYEGTDLSPAALGGFQYQSSPEGIAITDRYDFNTERGDVNDNSLGKRLLAALVAQKAYASHLGRRFIPPGKGVDVRINLGGKPQPWSWQGSARKCPNGLPIASGTWGRHQIRITRP